MKTKHTPGPWAIVDRESGIVVRTETENKSKYGASRYAAIGGFDRGNTDQLAEAHANARLIAAAPDLFEALHRVLCTHDYHTDDGAEASDFAHSIIAQIEGE